MSLGIVESQLSDATLLKLSGQLTMGREAAAWLGEGKVEEARPALRRARELGMDVDAALRADYPALSADPRLR